MTLSPGRGWVDRAQCTLSELEATVRQENIGPLFLGKKNQLKCLTHNWRGSIRARLRDCWTIADSGRPREWNVLVNKR